ncbi:MAG TPA: hypothetical protein DEP87_03115 [Candidatus Pacebacteria bacterium]|nr:hypothetical protein [Candidatus Paceibacterota bacterium]
MSWQILITLSILTGSVAVLLQRLILRSGKINPTAFSIFIGLFCGVIITILTGLFGQLDFSGVLAVWPNLVLTTLIYAIGGVISNLALQKTEVSKFTVLFSSRGLVTILAAMIILGERVTSSQALGAILIFFGVVVASWEAQKIKFQNGDWLSLLAAVIYGLANVNDRYMLQHMSLYPYLILAFLLPSFLLMLVWPKSVKELPTFFSPSKIKISLCLLGLFVFSAIWFYEALKAAPNAAQVVSANLAGVIVAVGLSMIFLKERKAWPQKFLGAVFSFVGLLFLN